MTKEVYKPNFIRLDKVKLLFFDIFYKNNKIHMIMPIYNIPANPQNIIVTVNNTILKLVERHVKDSIEPALIHIYEYISPPNTTVKINIKLINNSSISYDLQHIYTLEKIPTTQTTKQTTVQTTTQTTKHKFLALTTLFKNDYYIFPLFYNYYKEQGVQHFYMYYNGIITSEIIKLFNIHDVTLIEWNFHYWNPREIKYAHHAQMGQMHHALYKYGKDIYDYMVFCDLDEYLHIPKHKFPDTIISTSTQLSPIKPTIYDFIIMNSSIDIFGFCNFWANTIDDKMPSRYHLPKKILAVTESCEYCERSKNIYKVSSINTIGVHQMGCDHTLTSITDLHMYHFYRWSYKKRIINNCTNIVDLS
jgi:hypothetical protein